MSSGTLVIFLSCKGSESGGQVLLLVFSVVKWVLKSRRRTDDNFASLVSKSVNVFEVRVLELVYWFGFDHCRLNLCLCGDATRSHVRSLLS